MAENTIQLCKLKCPLNMMVDLSYTGSVMHITLIMVLTSSFISCYHGYLDTSFELWFSPSYQSLVSPYHEAVLTQLHEGHQGIVQTKSLARMYVWCLVSTEMWTGAWDSVLPARRVDQNHQKPPYIPGAGPLGHGHDSTWTTLVLWKGKWCWLWLTPSLSG